MRVSYAERMTQLDATHIREAYNTIGWYTHTCVIRKALDTVGCYALTCAIRKARMTQLDATHIRVSL